MNFFEVAICINDPDPIGKIIGASQVGISYPLEKICLFLLEPISSLTGAGKPLGGSGNIESEQKRQVRLKIALHPQLQLPQFGR